MSRMKMKAAVCAASTGLAFAAFAVTQVLPTPPPGEYADTESSVNVPIADWLESGRRVKLVLEMDATPTNAIQVAFGTDLNGDEDLEPEEVMLVVGVDCGVPFGRWETVSQYGGEYLCPPPSGFSTTCVFNFTQPRKPSDCFTLAKVTTRGRGNQEARIVAEIIRPGTVLFLR